jgi:Tol biopolymer transport system component
MGNGSASNYSKAIRRSLAVIVSEGGPIRQLTYRPGHARSYSWSPDGKEIAIAA